MRDRLTGALLLATIAVAVTGVTSAAAQEAAPTAEEYGLEVLVGFGGRGAPVAWTPVEVRLAPDRPLRATLAVASLSNFGSTYREVTSIEVGGGSAKAYRFVVPPGSIGVTITEPGRQQLSVQAGAGAPPGFLVGRVGGAVEDTPPLRDDALGRNGTWVPVDAEWLALPRALESLDGLVAEVGAVADLPEGSRRALATEVVAGLDLVLVSGPGPVDAATLGLPSALAASIDAQGRVTTDSEQALQLTDAAVVANAGNGRLAITSQRLSAEGAATAGRLWSTLVGPRGPLREAAANASLPNAPFRLSEMFATGQTEALRIPWLAAFLVAYVAVVGPLNAFVLARARRRELAWVTTPLVTVVFTLAGFAAATGGASTEVTVGRAVWWLDGAGRERVVAAARATSDGARSLELVGPAWAVRPISDFGAQGEVTRSDHGARVTMELRSLQVGGLVADRPVTTSAPLQITARSVGRGVRVQVRNTSTQPLIAVEVRVATSTQRVGSLAPGQEADLLIDEAHLPAVDPYAWEQASGGPPPPGQERGPDAFELLLRADVLSGNPGVAWAVGQRPDGAAELVASGGADRGTLIAVGATISADEQGLAGPFAWHRAALPSDENVGRGPLHVEGAPEVVVRFRPPPGAQLIAPLFPDLPRFSTDTRQVDAWSAQDGVWVPLSDLFPGGVGDPQRLLGPAGDLYVRAQGDLFPLDLSGLGMSTVAETAP